MPGKIPTYVFSCAVLFGAASCKQKNETLFTALEGNKLGINFQNNIPDTGAVNILNYIYYYNGGGVGLADFNNDGLIDIYMVSNREKNKMYINKGEGAFEEAGDAAGIAGQGNWKTGVSIVDINNDGLQDIYVSEVGGFLNLHGKNELFINHPGLHFTEESAKYGLDVEGFNTQAVFFDYDKDGDLDMFVVNHSVHRPENFQNASIRTKTDSAGGDKLFRNDSSEGRRHFTEVTNAACIYSSAIGYGLNAAVGDLNNDGWPDLYVSNDFHENDYYYLNNRKGGFTEINQAAFGHESKFSMGSAIADLNNDGWLDILTLDMLPADEKVLKSSASDDAFDVYNMKHALGFHYQNMRNCLQLNTGNGYRFADVGLYAGIAATDWSWSPLAADFDNDGIKDIFISNGIVRRPNDLDYLTLNAALIYHQVAGKENDDKAISSMPEGKVQNVIFKGTSSMQYIDKSGQWGMGTASVSTGAACADLDNDGDVDIVVNNINAPLTIYRNETSVQRDAHFLNIQLLGPADNRNGFGARVKLFKGTELQVAEFEGGCGFESSSVQGIHFGTGADTVIDKLVVEWPDGKTQQLNHVKTSQVIKLQYAQAGMAENKTALAVAPVFIDITDSIGNAIVHRENHFNDFAIQPFIPHMLSTQGPHIAVGDVNGDGLDDFFIGGSRFQPGRLFFQNSSGKFTNSANVVFKNDSSAETVDAIFFDADKDGDLDLYTVSGGNEIRYNDSALLDRLYINDGKGNYFKSGNLPVFFGNKSVAVAADIDKDGDLDLFIGGRSVAGNYGAVPQSYILLNDGHGKFSLETERVAPGLKNAGMVTDAVWTDIDNDGWKDLVVVGEWMPVTVFKNQHGVLSDYTAKAGLSCTKGLWNCIAAADINNDGYEDLVAGNLGLNSKLSASASSPLQMYCKDIDGNGNRVPLLLYDKKGVKYSFLGKDEMERQIPWIKKRTFGYARWAGVSIDSVIPGYAANATKLEVTTLASSICMNSKAGIFRLIAMPSKVQYSPVFSVLAGAFNINHDVEIMTGGNFYGVSPFEGRYDAMPVTLQVVHHAVTGASWPLVVDVSGLPAVNGELRDIKKIRLAGGAWAILLARNNDTVLVWKRIDNKE